MDGKARRGTAHEIYSTFIDRERKYGHLSTFSDQLRAKWQHLRASTSDGAFWMYYDCPQQVSHDFDVRSFCPDATKALFLICNCPNVRSHHVGDLLKLRADPNSQCLEKADTPLHRLIRLNKVKGVKLLVDWGADLNRSNITGRTPLMMACDSVESKKQLRIVKYLLKQKSVHIHACDKFGDSAAILAIRRSNVWTLRELFMKGVSVMAAGYKRRCFSVDEHQCHISAIDISRNLWDSSTGMHDNRAKINDVKGDTEESIDSFHEDSSVVSHDKQRMKLKVGRFEENVESTIETLTERDKVNMEGNIAAREGIQWTQRMALMTDCIRKRKQEVCYLMVLRKTILEALDAINGSVRLKALQKVYRKDDIHTNPSPRKMDNTKLLRILNNEVPESLSTDMEIEMDSDGGFSRTKTLEDAEMQRDKRNFTKHKKEKKMERSLKKKKDKKKNTTNSTAVQVLMPIDEESKDGMIILKSCLTIGGSEMKTLKNNEKEKEKKRGHRKDRKYANSSCGSIIPRSSSPTGSVITTAPMTPAKPHRCVTFGDDF